MKKVMKKFNRALSIMLVAAMVLTMAPQTAMPVLAAEPEVETQVDEPEADTTGDDAISDEGDKTPAADDEESEDVTEVKPEGNSANSDDTSEQDKSEKGEPAKSAENSVTPVTKSAEDSEAEDEESDDPSEVQFNAEPNAAEGVGDAVSINIVYRETGVDEPISEEVADVTFMSGVDAGGSAIGGEDVVFYVNPNPGWQAPGVAATIQKENAATHEMHEESGTVTNNAPKYSLATNGSKKTFTGDITITITGTRVTNTLKKDGSLSATVYLVGTAGDTVNPEITTTGAASLPFSMFDEDAEIKVAIQKDSVTNKYYGLTAEIDGVAGDATKCVRSEGTEQITIGGTQTECVTFTFKPSDLAGYESKVNTNNTTFVLKATTGALKTLTVKADATSELTDAKELSSDLTTLNTQTNASGTVTYYTLSIDNASDALASLGLNEENYAKVGGAGDDKDNNRVLVFGVEPDTGNQVSVTKVWAELTIPGSPIPKKVQEIEASKLTYTTGTPAVEKSCYAIDLSEIKAEIFTNDVTMTIKAETEYKAEDTDEGFEVHNIKFTGDLNTVEIKEKDLTSSNFDNTDKKPLANPLTNQDATFNFTIRPKAGYSISKGTNYNTGGNKDDQVVTVSSSKTWKINVTPNGGLAAKDYFITVPDLKDEELKLSGTGVYGLDTDLTTGDTNQALSDDLKALFKEKYPDELTDTELGSATADYSLKNIEINVKTELVKDLTGVVRVECPVDMSYEITGTDIVKKDVSTSGNSLINDVRYEIGEDADILVLSITSPVKPAVSLCDGAGDSPSTWSNLTQDGDVYTAEIPVGELNHPNDVINAKIKISKGDDKTITVNETFDKEPVTGPPTFAGKIKVEGEDTKPDANYVAAGVSIKNGSDITVTLTAKAGRLFDKVTYKVGAEGEAQEATVSDDKTKASFSVKMTENVTVTAETSSTFRYEVKYGDASDKNANAAGDNVYAIPAGVKKVQIKAFNGDTEQDVQTVKVYDGSETAAAKAALSGSPQNTITLTLSEKDGDLIRLELKGKRNNTGKLIDLPSISIRQDKAAEEILIADEDGNKIESVNLTPGESKDYKVSVVSGSLDFVDGNIKMEIARDASKAGNKTGVDSGNTQIVEYDNITATYNKTDKVLTIAGKMVKTGNDNAVILRFYDVAKRQKADEANKLGIIAGSEISVKLDTPAVAEMTPEVSAFNTVHNVQLALSTPGFKEIRAKNGKEIYYRINIAEAVNLPNGATDAAKADNIKENVRGVATPYSTNNKFANGNKTIYVKKTGESQEILLPINYQYETNGIDLKKVVKKFNLTVDLVHHVDGNSEKDVWDDTNNLIASQAVKLATETAKATYQTKLTLSAASATVYTGQDKQKIASASFDNNEGVCQLKTSFVNAKTGVSAYVYGLTPSAGVDGSIYVDASGMNSAVKDIAAAKDLGLKVSAYADDAKEVSQIIKIKLVDGVTGIAFENGEERVLYKQDGKAATMKLKAVLNEANGVKPKKATITYVLADDAGEEINTEGCKLSQNLKSSVTVNAKNGTVKVSKDYVHNKDNCTFGVIAKATGMYQTDFVKITISQEAQAKGDIVIVDGTGKVVARDGGTLSPELFTTNTLYVKALKSTVKQTINEYNRADYAEGVSFTSGNKKALTISTTTGQLKLLSASKKAVKITAVNTDGSKKVKSTISINLAGPKSLGLNIQDSQYHDVHHVQQGTTYRYSGSMKERFVIYPLMDVNGVWTDIPDNYYKNLKITVKSAKKTQPKNANHFEIVKSAPVTTITIADKTDKNVAPVTYTIEQFPATPVKGKTLKIKSPKITQQMVNSARNADTYEDGILKLKFQISGKDAASYAGKFILLAPDYSKTKLVNKIAGTEEYRRASNYFLNSSDQKVVKIDADGSFTLELPMRNSTDASIVPGTYKLLGTIGEYKSSGMFESVDGVKIATVSVKLPGKAPKNLSLQTEANYTLSTGGEAVDLATGISSAFSWTVSDGINGNYAKNVVNEDGTTNNFRKYFYVKYDSGNNVYKLGMNSGLSGLKVADLDALLKDETGKDLKGYVTITSKGVNNTSLETRDVLINVTLDQASGLVAVANETYKGAEAIVKIYNTGDTKNACELKGVALDKSAGAQTGASVKLGDAESGVVKSLKVKIPANAAEEYTVDLKVLTKNSAYANAVDAPSNAAAAAEKYGNSVKVAIKVADPATATDVVEVKTSEDDLAFKAENTQTAYNNSLSTANKKNTYYASAKYVLRVDVKSKIDGAEVNYAAYDKTFTDKAVKNMITVNKGGNNEILLTLDRTKFLKEIAASETLERGATVEIPVTVKFNLSGLKEETVTLAVKLPNPLTYEEAKASMLAAEAEIAAMQPDEYLAANVTSQANLQKKINEAFRKALPLDTDAVVTPADDIVLTTNADGKYEQKVTVQAKAAKADGDYEHTFTWDVPDDTFWTAEALRDKIHTMLKIETVKADEWLEAQINALDHNKNADVKVSNDYTADNFMTDLLALLKKNNIALGSNLNINIKSFTRTKATADRAGSFAFTITVYDGKIKEESDEITGTLHIPQLTNLGTEGAAVKAALDTMDYEQAIYDALGKGDIDSLEDNLKDAIEATAKSALTNKEIEVEFVAVNSAIGDTNYVANGKKDVAYVLPDENSGGELRYQINLKLAGMKDYIIKYTEASALNAKITLNNGTVGKTGKDFQTVNAIATKLSGNSGGAAEDKVLSWTAPSDPALGKAEFTEKVEVKGDESREEKVKATVQKLLGKLVTGMYLNVEVSVDNTTSTDNLAKGTVTVEDRKRRAEVTPSTDPKTYTYEFDYEIGILAPVNSTTKLSTLGNPTVMSEARYNALSGQLSTGKPTYDRVGGGLTVGAPERIGEYEYKVPVTGTLKYVEGWTGFSTSTLAYNSGYYAMVDIPIPNELKTIATANDAAEFIQIAHDETKELTGTQIVGENGTLNIMTRVMPEVNTTKVAKGTKSGIRGFKVVVDYNSLSSSTVDSNGVVNDNKAYNADTNAIGGKEYQFVTYTFDMSGVTLDNSSEAKINVLSGSELVTAITDYSTMGLDATKMNVSGSNNAGKSSVVKVTGELTKQELTGFSSVSTNNEGYYMIVTVEAPDYVRKADGSTDHLSLYNPTTPVSGSGPYTDPTDYTKPAEVDANATTKAFEKTTILVRVNDEDLNGGKNVITISVDWDGADLANWASTTYTLDLSNVTYK